MKNQQAIILLFISNIISGLAQGISMIAIPWYFIEIIDKPEFFAYSYIVITSLTLFWDIYAGSIIDRYSRKKIFILTMQLQKLMKQKNNIIKRLKIKM